MTEPIHELSISASSERIAELEQDVKKKLESVRTNVQLTPEEKARESKDRAAAFVATMRDHGVPAVQAFKQERKLIGWEGDYRGKSRLYEDASNELFGEGWIVRDFLPGRPWDGDGNARSYAAVPGLIIFDNLETYECTAMVNGSVNLAMEQLIDISLRAPIKSPYAGSEGLLLLKNAINRPEVPPINRIGSSAVNQLVIINEPSKMPDGQ